MALCSVGVGRVVRKFVSECHTARSRAARGATWYLNPAYFWALTLCFRRRFAVALYIELFCPCFFCRYRGVLKGLEDMPPQGKTCQTPMTITLGLWGLTGLDGYSLEVGWRNKKPTNTAEYATCELGILGVKNFRLLFLVSWVKFFSHGKLLVLREGSHSKSYSTTYNNVFKSLWSTLAWL